MTDQPSSSIKPVLPSLERRAEFARALENYQPSAEALALLRDTPFVGMLAPSATGRNTIINELVKTGHYHYVISDTTRPPRVNDGVPEKNGVEYFFRTEAEMLDEIKQGRFLEAEIIHDQQVSGTSIREIEQAHAEQKIAITDVDLLGTLRILSFKPNATVFLLLPPSFEEWLNRIMRRAPTTTQTEVNRRLQTAARIFARVLEDERYICIINDRLDDTVAAVDAIARLGTRQPEVERRARAVGRELRKRTTEYLRQHDIT